MDSPGSPTHEWLGIELGVVLLVHVTLHWDWVIRTTRKLLRPGGRERFVWLVNLLLLLSMVLCIASGILISEVALPELGITLRASTSGRRAHDQRHLAAAPPDAAYRRQGVERPPPVPVAGTG